MLPGPSRRRNVPGAEVAVGGAERVDQACDGVPAVQRAGMEAVRGEWNLVCLALNIRRMHGLSTAAAGGG